MNSRQPVGLGARFYCVIPGCNAATTRLTAREMLCERHWLMVLSDVKAIMERKYRQLKLRTADWTEPFSKAIEWAINEVLQIQMSGHRIPKPIEFMWDDP